jgi:hypothetical protein
MVDSRIICAGGGADRRAGRRPIARAMVVPLASDRAAIRRGEARRPRVQEFGINI